MQDFFFKIFSVVIDNNNGYFFSTMSNITYKCGTFNKFRLLE